MPSLQTAVMTPSMSRGLLAAALLGAGVLSAGCNVPRERSQPAGVAIDGGEDVPFPHDAWKTVGYRLDWRGYPFAGGRTGPDLRTIRAWGDFLIAQDRSSSVSLLESSTGAVRWTTDLASPLTRFVAVARDTRDASLVLIASESELFGLAAQTGNLVIREKFEKVVNTRAVLTGPMAVFGSSTGEVQAHVIGRGVKAWGFSTAGAIEADPVRVGDAIGVVSQAGDIVFLSDSGNLLGRNRIYGALVNDPVANDTAMFVAGLDQSLWAFEPSGALRWRVRHSAPLRAQPATDGPRVYCDLPGLGMTAFDAASGKQLWAASIVRGDVIGTRGGKLIVWDGGTLSVLDPLRGDVLASSPIDNVKFIRADQFADGHLFAAGADGAISKLTPIR